MFSNTTTPPTRRLCQLETLDIIYAIVCCVVIILVVLGNSLILYKFKIFSFRRRPNIEVLIIYLSSYDLLASIMLIMDVYEKLTCFQKWPLFWFGCKMVYPLYHISLNMSVAILLIMSIDRCWSIVSPLKKKFSKKSIHLTMLVSLVVSVSLQWYQFNALLLTPGGVCVTHKGTKVFAISRITTVLSRDLAIITVFTVTSILVYKSLLGNDILQTSQIDKKKFEARRVLTMLLIMEIVFAVLVVPYDIYDSAMFITWLIHGKVKMNQFTQYLDQVLTVLQMSNSFANCFVYAKMHRHLRKRTSTNSAVTQLDYQSKRASRASIWSNPTYNPDDVYRAEQNNNCS